MGCTQMIKRESTVHSCNYEPVATRHACKLDTPVSTRHGCKSTPFLLPSSASTFKTMELRAGFYSEAHWLYKQFFDFRSNAKAWSKFHRFKSGCRRRQKEQCRSSIASSCNRVQFATDAPLQWYTVDSRLVVYVLYNPFGAGFSSVQSLRALSCPVDEVRSSARVKSTPRIVLLVSSRHSAQFTSCWVNPCIPIAYSHMGFSMGLHGNRWESMGTQ